MSTALADCPRCHSPVEREDLRCVVCACVLAVVEDRETVRIDFLRCDGCGAAVSLREDGNALECAFCGSELHRETVEDPVDQAEAYLPFTVDREAAQDALRNWLSGLGWFRPGDLVDASRIESLQPLYWVAWVFDARVQVSYTADTEAGAKKARWAPCAGQADLHLQNVLISASQGLSKEETSFAAAGCDTRTLAPEPTGADDAVVERFQLPRSAARHQVLQAVQASVDHRVVAECLPGRRHRKLKTALLLRGLVTRRLAFPAWVMAYRYGNEVYRAVICGQDASRVLADAPWSTLRIVAAILGGLGLIGFFGLLAAMGG
ncbi:MAG: hypothetical protein AAF533_16780 [Acidobacteriota bacterium]